MLGLRKTRLNCRGDGSGIKDVDPCIQSTIDAANYEINWMFGEFRYAQFTQSAGEPSTAQPRKRSPSKTFLTGQWCEIRNGMHDAALLGRWCHDCHV